MSHIDEIQKNHEAPLLLHSGRVFTGSELHPTATAVLVVAGRIQHVGANEELFKLAGSEAQRVDVHGGLITPGFIDAHIHPVYGGMERNACDLTAAESHSETLQAVQDYVERHTANPTRSAEWIFGGWLVHRVFLLDRSHR